MDIKEKLVKIIPNANADTLDFLIENAKNYAVTYCNLPQYQNDLDDVVTLMAIEDFNKFGSEGIKSRSVSGVSESYSENYSPKVLEILNSKGKLRW